MGIGGVYRLPLILLWHNGFPGCGVVNSSAAIGRSSWRYYQRTVAGGACEYYAEHGDAPGRWHGAGLTQIEFLNWVRPMSANADGGVTKDSCAQSTCAVCPLIDTLPASSEDGVFPQSRAIANRTVQGSSAATAVFRTGVAETTEIHAEGSATLTAKAATTASGIRTRPEGPTTSDFRSRHQDHRTEIPRCCLLTCSPHRQLPTRRDLHSEPGGL